MRPDLSARDAVSRELMDDPDADPRMLRRTYALFPVVNAVVAGWRGIYRRDIRPYARRGAVRLLDVGSGGGDVTRALSRRLRRDDPAAQVTGLDPDRRAIAWAARRRGGRRAERGAVRWVCASTGDLVRDGETYDVVVSNHLLHHLDAGTLRALLYDSLRLVAPGGTVIHGDIARSRGAYGLFAALTLPFSRTLSARSFIRPDGLTSIRRSYTADELAAAAGPGWRVERRLPARLLLRAEVPDARS